MKQIIFALSLLGSFSSAHAGWVSSGGMLFKDEYNPWFLRNVSTVEYCVDVASSMSVTKTQAQTLVREAIDYWKSEFAQNQPASPTKGTFLLGTQTFVEVPTCTATTDLRFLLGFETLSQDEKNWLKDPRKYVGISVRTDYDEATMRGRGFVYVSSDMGPNAYLNSNSELIEKAWQYPILLKYVLLHEMGHVFGFPHAGGGLMSEVLMDQLLNKQFYSIFVKAPVESFLAPAGNLEVCQNVDQAMKDWFGAPAGTTCLYVQKKADGDFTVSAKASATAAPTALGSLKSPQINIMDVRSRPGVILHLTDSQTVFSQPEAAFRSFMNGPQIQDFGGKTTFVPATAGVAPKVGYLRVTPASFAVFASSANQIKPVFLHNSMIALALNLVP